MTPADRTQLRSGFYWTMGLALGSFFAGGMWAVGHAAATALWDWLVG